MSAMAQLCAWEVLDSHGNPTVAVTCCPDSGDARSAIVASGAWAGRFEAQELHNGEECHASRVESEPGTQTRYPAIAASRGSKGGDRA